MAIAALLLWMCTAAVGGYLLATSTRAGNAAAESGEPVPAAQAVPAPQPPRPAAQPSPVAAQPGGQAHSRDRFDPPSLARAKSEPLPGMRALAEFTHPALAMIGLAFWLFYVISRDRVFAAIGFGVLLGAIAAGLSWAAANARAARRAEVGRPGTADREATAGQRVGALSVTPRVLILHATGAALTLLIAALIAARA